MKLGTQTASLSNHVMSLQTVGQPDPVIGMGATLLGWTDRHAGTIIRVESDVVAVQMDHARRLDANGMSESQAYAHQPNTRGAIHHFRLRKGRWEPVERNETTRRWNLRVNGFGLKIGVRQHYHDFSF